jgi:hypothetical protein
MHCIAVTKVSTGSALYRDDDDDDDDDDEQQLFHIQGFRAKRL